MASTLSCVQLHKRAERVSQMAMETGKLSSGDRIALVYPPGTLSKAFAKHIQVWHCISQIALEMVTLASRPRT